MTLDQSPKINDALIWRKLDDNTVLVSPQSGEVRVLNGIGSIIWQMLADKHSPTSIEQHLVQAYDVSPDQAQEDITRFIGDLQARGLIDL